MEDAYIGRFLDDRYEILEKIGTGGMAVVYKARCHRLNRFVAIKILKSSLAEDRHQFLRVFSAGICCEQLVHRVRVVASRLSFADTLILKS